MSLHRARRGREKVRSLGSFATRGNAQATRWRRRRKRVRDGQPAVRERAFAAAAAAEGQPAREREDAPRYFIGSMGSDINA